MGYQTGEAQRGRSDSLKSLGGEISCWKSAFCCFMVLLVGGGVYVGYFRGYRTWDDSKDEVENWDKSRCVVTRVYTGMGRRAQTLQYAAGTMAMTTACSTIVHARTQLDRCGGNETLPPTPAPTEHPRTERGCECSEPGWFITHGHNVSGPGSSESQPCDRICCDPDARGVPWCPVKDQSCEHALNGTCDAASMFAPVEFSSTPKPTPPPEGPPKSVHGCECMERWYLGECEAPECNSSAPGGAQFPSDTDEGPCINYCCNPNNDPKGDWCFVNASSCDTGKSQPNQQCAGREKHDVVWDAGCSSFDNKLSTGDEIDCWVDPSCHSFDPDDPKDKEKEGLLELYIGGGAVAAGCLGCCCLGLCAMCRSRNNPDSAREEYLTSYAEDGGQAEKYQNQNQTPPGQRSVPPDGWAPPTYENVYPDVAD